MELASYALRLADAVATGKKSAFDSLCFDLEYEQLLQETWPQDVFNFFADALCDPDVCRLSGSRSLVLTLYNDFDKLTYEQRNLLASVFDANLDTFDDEMLRHSVGDMVARKYAVPVGLKFFDEWMNSGTPYRTHAARVGYEVLIMTSRLQPPAEDRVRRVLQQLRH